MEGGWESFRGNFLGTCKGLWEGGCSCDDLRNTHFLLLNIN